jgi:hypothetical protein
MRALLSIIIAAALTGLGFGVCLDHSAMDRTASNSSMNSVSNWLVDKSYGVLANGLSLPARSICSCGGNFQPFITSSKWPSFLVSSANLADAFFIFGLSTATSLDTSSASPCAVSADFAALPAFWSASVNFARSYSWTALCASSSLSPHLHSATTPSTTTISPILVDRLTHLGWSEFDSALICASAAGKISASSSWTADSFFLTPRRLLHARASWRSSTPSIATPIATVMFASPTNLEKWRTCASSAFLMGSSIGGSENMSDWLGRRGLPIPCDFTLADAPSLSLRPLQGQGGGFDLAKRSLRGIGGQSPRPVAGNATRTGQP